MQAQSRLGVNGGAGGFGSAAVDEAVVRELMRGHELTAQLQAEVLRGQGQAEATVAFILREMSRAFTICISIMGGSASAATAPPDATVAAAVAPRANKDDGIPRKRSVTSSPHSDGHQWRKYGQKNIMRTSFPRCYYRCRYHRERSCPATKQVQQQHGDGDPTMYLVTYIHEHTCHHKAPAEPEAAAAHSAFSAGLSRQEQGGVSDIVLDRGAKEELEHQALVSSLAYVLQGGLCYSGGGTLEESSSQGCTGDGAYASAVSLDASDVGLDVMDWDVTDTVYFVTSSTYGLRDDGMLL